MATIMDKMTNFVKTSGMIGNFPTLWIRASIILPFTQLDTMGITARIMVTIKTPRVWIGVIRKE